MLRMILLFLLINLCYAEGGGVIGGGGGPISNTHNSFLSIDLKVIKSLQMQNGWRIPINQIAIVEYLYPEKGNFLGNVDYFELKNQARIEMDEIKAVEIYPISPLYMPELQQVRPSLAQQYELFFID